MWIFKQEKERTGLIESIPYLIEEIVNNNNKPAVFRKTLAIERDFWNRYVTEKVQVFEK